MRETGSFMHLRLLTARALGGSGHKHTGLDLETMLLPPASCGTRMDSHLGTGDIYLDLVRLWPSSM